MATTRGRSEYIDEIKSMIQDSASKLTTTDLDKILNKAASDYSRARPFVVRKKIQGNGAAAYRISDTIGALWTHGFSSVREIEYPIGYMPKSVIESKLYELYDDGSAQDGSNTVLRFDSVTISDTDYFIAEITVERVIPAEDGASPNFPDTNETFSNITTLASAYACQRLAAAYAQSADASIGADTVNYNDKSSKYQSLAKQYMGQYNIAVFGSEVPVAAVGAAIESRVVERTDSIGGEYIFHRRRR